MINTRKQLTLFLDAAEADSIERIRAKFNPAQFKIIRSHITLCREHEIEALETVLNNLDNLKTEQFELGLDELIRFSEGKGVLIKVKDKQNHFQKLRAAVLKNTTPEPGIHTPHITLMHPRNSSCNDSIFEEIKEIGIPEKLRITSITLIEQEIGKKWKVLKEYKLKTKSER